MCVRVIERQSSDIFAGRSVVELFCTCWSDAVRPRSPVDVKATWERATVHIAWRHSPSQPVVRYDIQYRTVGRWVPLATVSGNATSYDWTTPSRGATYQFRLFAVAVGDLRSEPSPSASIQTTGQRERVVVIVVVVWRSVVYIRTVCSV